MKCAKIQHERVLSKYNYTFVELSDYERCIFAELFSCSFSGKLLLPMSKTTSKVLQIVITTALFGFSIYFALSNINFSRLLEYLQSVNYWYFLATIPIVILSHYIRATRWKILVDPLKKQIKTLNLFSGIMIGYGINNIIPRGGELVRPFVVAKREKIPIPSLVATVVLERFFDVLNLLFFISIATLLFTDKLQIALPSVSANQMIVYAGIPTILLLTAIILFAFTNFGKWVITKVISPISEKFAEKAATLLQSFTKGLDVVKQPKSFLPLVLQSILIWILYAIPVYILFYAFGLQTQLSFSDAALLLIITSVGVAIAPTPGTVGVYHLFMQEAMNKLYSIPLEEGLAFATLSHSVHYLLSFLLGGFFMVRENISPKESLSQNSTSID